MARGPTDRSFVKLRSESNKTKRVKESQQYIRLYTARNEVLTQEMLKSHKINYEDKKILWY
jgi:hypothetical protein